MSTFKKLVNLFLMFPFLVGDQEVHMKKPKTDIHYFLVIGQSNAITRDGFGLGDSFKAQMKKLGYKKVVLISAAVPGSGIYDWQKGRQTGYYAEAMFLTRYAMPADGKLDGVIFFQGENEAKGSPFAKHWGLLFETLVSNIRMDFDNPTLPVVFAQIACKNPKELVPDCLTVQNQQESVNIANVQMILTCDLQYRRTDPTHMTKYGYNRLGVRFADAMFRLIK